MTTHTKQTIAIIIAFVAVIFSMTLEGHASAPSPAPGAHMPAPSPTPSIIEEDEDGDWNCMTMGDHRCGPQWVPAPSPLEGSDLRDHRGCLLLVGDTTKVVCPDGWIDYS